MTALLLLVLADVPPPPSVTACKSDSDCVISAIEASCCSSCCPPGPVARSKKEVEEIQRRCSTKRCARLPCETMEVMCADTETAIDLQAVCRGNRCVAQSVEADGCTKDSDCTIATMGSCCGACCPEQPAAYLVKDVEAHRKLCAVTDCAAPRCTGDKKCAAVEPASALEAVCRAHRCAVVHVPKAECSKDSDCRVDYPPLDEHASCRSSPCGCCPTTSPIAVPVSAPRRSLPPPMSPPRPLTKKDGPKFGLSPGDVPPPQCSPCPSQEPAKAICSERHCVLDRPHAL